MTTSRRFFSARALAGALLGALFAVGCSAAPTDDPGGEPAPEVTAATSAALFSTCGPIPPVAVCLRPVCPPGAHTWQVVPAPLGTQCGGGDRVCNGHGACVTAEPPDPQPLPPVPVATDGAP